jgi:hypothetical protein
VIQRVQHFAFVKQSKVQVRGRITNPGAPHFAEALTRLYAVANLDVVARQM